MYLVFPSSVSLGRNLIDNWQPSPPPAHAFDVGETVNWPFGGLLSVALTWAGESVIQNRTARGCLCSRGQEWTVSFRRVCGCGTPLSCPMWSSCVAAVSGSPCRELWFVMQGVGAPTERKLQDTSWWDSSSPSVLLCFPFSLCDQCWGAQRLVCPWDGHRQDLPCGPVDWLADEGQCYIGTEEIGSGDGTLLLVDRAKLFEFRKRHHFLKILHWHVPENCCSKQTNLWWLWGERNSQELCNAKLALPLVAALLGPHWASPASPPALCLVVSSQESHVAMK